MYSRSCGAYDDDDVAAAETPPPPGNNVAATLPVVVVEVGAAEWESNGAVFKILDPKVTLS